MAPRVLAGIGCMCRSAKAGDVPGPSRGYLNLGALAGPGAGHVTCALAPGAKEPVPPLRDDLAGPDDPSRDRILAKLPSNAKPNITRFKGLGEMPAQLLYETTLDPARRRLLRVNIPEDDRAYTERTVTDLMGKEPEQRFKFIMAEAYTAKDIDI